MFAITHRGLGRDVPVMLYAAAAGVLFIGLQSILLLAFGWNLYTPGDRMMIRDGYPEYADPAPLALTAGRWLLVICTLASFALAAAALVWAAGDGWKSARGRRAVTAAVLCVPAVFVIGAVGVSVSR